MQDWRTRLSAGLGLLYAFAFACVALFVLFSFVTGGKMPLNAKLTIAERSVLYNQLVNDYFAINATQPGILRAWLLGRIRSTDSNANSLEH